MKSRIIRMLMAVAMLSLAAAAWAQPVVSIYDLQQDLIADNTVVTVQGKIVTAVDDIPSGMGFFIQEPAGGANSGIYVFVGTVNVPTVIIGDVVDVTGMYDDYFPSGAPGTGLAELNLSVPHGGQGSYTKVGTGQVPTPIVLRAWQTKTANRPEAEKWECVLVRHLNVQRTAVDPGFGEWFGMEFGFIDNDETRFDDGLGVSGPPAGTQMSSVTGVLNYTFSEFKVTPRGQYDIVYVGAAPAPTLEYAAVTGASSLDVRFDRPVLESTAENPANYFLDLGTVSTATLDPGDPELVHLTLAAPMTPAILLTLTVIDVQNTDGVAMAPEALQFWGGVNTVAFSQYPDAGGDSSAVAGEILTIKGVIHSEYDVWGNHFYLQEVNREGGSRSPYNGLEVYAPAFLPQVAEGDIVIIADAQTEYYNMTSFTQPFYYFEKVSSGNTVAPPEVITIGDMADPAVWEPYEGALVRVTNVTVVERAGSWNFYAWSVTQDDINWLKVGDMGDYDYLEGLGDILNITGTLRYEFGNFVLMPRRDADIEILYQNPNGTGELPAGARIALAQNHPNPFNPTTKIGFVLAAAGEARLEIFDTAGRLVQTLLAANLEAGRHELSWAGETAAGGQASSGLYYYRLTADGESQTRKMLMLK
ncbi:T9SS type A sorting domain-containing protein [bacterium]|nr:T9SS type A sorting domain-containing protein [bacterium]